MERKNQKQPVKEEREEMIQCAWKILENLQMQINISTDKERIKSLKKHQKVTQKMILNLMEVNSPIGS